MPNVFVLMEATKNMTTEEKNEYLDRIYKRERLLMDIRLKEIYESQEERRNYDIEG